MKIEASQRIQSLPEYAFKLVDDRVSALKAKGVTPIDLGVGDPATPTPERIRSACKEALDSRATAGYPSYIGDMGFRAEVAAWTERRYGISIDPATEITTTIGSKEGIFNFPEAFINPGDLVIIPSPGYPPYSIGTKFAEGRCYYYGLNRANGFLPDLDAIPAEVAAQAKVMWINYPNSPSGRSPNLDAYKRIYEWTRKHNIILASDEAYSEFYYGDEAPPTALQAGKEGVIVFNSLSKRSAMTCYRVGWASGDERIIGVYRQMKTNVDSGTATFIQDAAVNALRDETHVDAMREEYRRKRDLIVDAFKAIGLDPHAPEGTIYIWQPVPAGMTSMDFAEKLMDPAIGIVTTPGNLIANELTDGTNPGEGFIRISLSPEMETIELAAQRIAQLQL